jgi:hypothetical protein
MAPPEKQSKSSGVTGTLAAVGIACGFIGAVVGVVGWDLWKKEKMHSGYVIYSRVKSGFSCVTD